MHENQLLNYLIYYSLSQSNAKYKSIHGKGHPFMIAAVDEVFDRKVSLPVYVPQTYLHVSKY